MKISTAAESSRKKPKTKHINKIKHTNQSKSTNLKMILSLSCYHKKTTNVRQVNAHTETTGSASVDLRIGSSSDYYLERTGWGLIYEVLSYKNMTSLKGSEVLTGEPEEKHQNQLQYQSALVLMVNFFGGGCFVWRCRII